MTVVLLLLLYGLKRLFVRSRSAADHHRLNGANGSDCTYNNQYVCHFLFSFLNFIILPIFFTSRDPKTSF